MIYVLIQRNDTMIIFTQENSSAFSFNRGNSSALFGTWKNLREKGKKGNENMNRLFAVQEFFLL